MQNQALRIYINDQHLDYYKHAPGNYCHFVLGYLLEVFIELSKRDLLDKELIFFSSVKSIDINDFFFLFSAHAVEYASESPENSTEISPAGYCYWNGEGRGDELLEYLNKFQQFVRRKMQIPDDAEPNQITLIKRNYFNGKRYLVNSPSLSSDLNNYAEDKGLVHAHVDFAELTFREQIDTMMRTKILIGPHGAGFLNLLFMPSGGTIVELLPHGLFDSQKFCLLGLKRKIHYVKHADPLISIPTLYNLILCMIRRGHFGIQKYYRDRNIVFDPKELKGVIEYSEKKLSDSKESDRPLALDLKNSISEVGFIDYVKGIFSHRKFVAAIVLGLVGTLLVGGVFWPLVFALAVCIVFFY